MEASRGTRGRHGHLVRGEPRDHRPAPEHRERQPGSDRRPRAPRAASCSSNRSSTRPPTHSRRSETTCRRTGRLTERQEALGDRQEAVAIGRKPSASAGGGRRAAGRRRRGGAGRTAHRAAGLPQEARDGLRQARRQLTRLRDNPLHRPLRRRRAPLRPWSRRTVGVPAVPAAGCRRCRRGPRVGVELARTSWTSRSRGGRAARHDRRKPGRIQRAHRGAEQIADDQSSWPTSRQALQDDQARPGRAQQDLADEAVRHRRPPGRSGAGPQRGGGALGARPQHRHRDRRRSGVTVNATPTPTISGL